MSESSTPKRKPQAKYDDATKAVTKRAQALRGRANAIAPVTVVRVLALLEREGKTPDQVVKAFKNLTDAKAYASATRP